MAYVGRPAPKLYFDAFTKDTFDGDGSTTSFTLSKAPGNVNSLLVAVDNVIQEPGVAFTLSDNTLTFTGAPSSGSDNIYACFWGGTLTITETSTVKTSNAATITGNLVPTSNVTFSLGEPASVWKELHAGDSFVTGNVSVTRSLAVGYTDGRVPQANLDVNGNVYISGNVHMRDQQILNFGTGKDLQIYHDGSDSYISDGGTGDLKIGGATNVKIQNPNGSEIMGVFTQDGAVDLYHNNSKKFETTSTGVSISGLGANVAGNVSVTRSLAVGFTDGRVPQANLEVTGNAVISGTSFPNAGAVGPLWTGRNWIMNGTGRINQRYGTSAATTINQYAMDRWRTYGGALGYELKSESEARTVADSSPDGQFISFRRTDSVTNNTGIVNGIETKNSKQFAGRTACLSFKARKGANFSSGSDALSCSIRSGEGTDENPISMTNMATTTKIITLTSTWQKFFFTADIDTDKTQLSVDFNYTPVGTVGADDSYDLTEVQLEIGSEPTPFELINYQDELLHCKRYYRTYGPGITGYWNGSSNIEFMFTFIPEMRATPTFAVLVTGPVISNKTNSATATEEDVAVINSSGTVNGMYFAQVGSCEDTSPSAGDIAQLRTDKFVSFDAEL